MVLRLCIFLLFCGIYPVLSIVAERAASVEHETTVWVKKDFFGGPLCGNQGRVAVFTPPGYENEVRRFRTANVVVRKKHFEDFSVCNRCDCPSYHRVLWFEILEGDVAKVAKFGYNRVAEDLDPRLR